MGILCPFPSRSCSAYIPKCCNPWSPHIAPRLPYRKKARNILYLIKYTDFSSPFSPELVPLATPHKTSVCPVPSSTMPRPLFSPVMFGYFLFFFCHPRALFSLLSSSDKRSVFRGSLDIRVKPEYDGKKNKPDNGRKRRKSCSGLTRASKKHKAEPHDMYIESNALQQRFVPQPVLRSSWQQLVLENVNRP